MKLTPLITVLILLSSTINAYQVSQTTTGTEPATSNDIVAFITQEEKAGQDLNNDNDTTDNILQYFDLATNKTTNTQMEGAHPAVSGKKIVFEDKTGRIAIYDTETKTATSLKQGTNPSISNNIIAFATSEKSAEADLNNDKDTEDTVIRYYELGSGKTANTKAIGNNPLALGDIIVFETKEEDTGEDLNGDEDTDDTIIQYYDPDEGEVVNTRMTGTNPVGRKGRTIIITDEKQFWTLDLQLKEKEPTGVMGTKPSLDGDLLAYEHGKLLELYRLSTGVVQSLGLKGTQPSLHAGTLAFVDDDKKITVIMGEDPDNDDVPDFADNCPTTSNPDQADSDKDGKGNACENAPAQQNTTPEITTQATTPTITTPAEPEEKINERQELPGTIVLKKEKESKNPTYWFLIAVGLIVITVISYFTIPRWLNRRRKSFGF